jgi:hypothetical protein
VKELRLFTLEGVADELKQPAEDKEPGGIKPQRVEKDTCEKKRQRDHNDRYTQSMAKPIDRMLMAARVLCNPLLVCASAQHALHDTAIGNQQMAISMGLCLRAVRPRQPLQRIG